jgi:hypothetical protein
MFLSFQMNTVNQGTYRDLNTYLNNQSVNYYRAVGAGRFIVVTLLQPPPYRPGEVLYRGAHKSLARPGKKQANVSDRMARISFRALPCRKNNLMAARVSMSLKSRASLACFRACFLPGRAKDLSAPRYLFLLQIKIHYSILYC